MQTKEKDLQLAFANPLFVGGSDSLIIPKMCENDTENTWNPYPFITSKHQLASSDFSIENHEVQEIFEDQGVSKSDFYRQKEVQEEFTPRKNLADTLAWALQEIEEEDRHNGIVVLRVSVNRVERCWNCGSLLTFAELYSGDNKLIKANFCRDRLCPMCQRRRSLKMFSQVSKIMDRLVSDTDSYGKLKFAFATFSPRNCMDSELAEMVDKLTKAYNLMTSKKRNAFRKGAILGTFRSIEIKKSDDPRFDWHPHLHAIFAMTPKYFNGKEKFYMTQREWRELWADCMGLDYLPQMNIHMIKEYVKGNDQILTKKGIEEVVAECAKYAVKGDEFLLPDDLEQTKHIVRTLIDSITGRRLYGFTGCFADARKKLKLDDIEDGDMIFLDGEKINTEIVKAIHRYQWGGFGYTEI